MKKLVLIGYMGAGKSTIGRKLSQKLQLSFLDTDYYIEEKQGRRISDIFEENGEEYFRSLETEALKELLEQPGDRILSTGGGLPLREENRKLLKQMGCTVYLQVSKETILERLKDDTTRPLLQVADREARIEEMLRARHPVYAETADFTVIVDGRDVDSIVQEILEKTPQVSEPPLMCQ